MTMAEDFGVEDRGRFYDAVGALRDVVQNHLMQVLALIAMEPPARAGLDAIDDRKHDVFTAMPTRPGPHGARPVRRLPRRRRASPRTPTPRRSWRCAPRSTTGAGPACRSTSAPARRCGARDRGAGGVQAPAEARVPRARAPPRAQPLLLRIDPTRARRIQLQSMRSGEPRLETVNLDVEFADDGGGADAPTRSCCMRRCGAIARTSPARTRSRRPGGSCSRARRATAGPALRARHVGPGRGRRAHRGPRRLARAMVRRRLTGVRPRTAAVTDP